MIMDEEVIIRWGINNKDYYVSKGYAFTKMKDEFHVKVRDLHSGSQIKINTKCSGCGNVEKKQYKNVYNSLHNTYRKSYYCINCIKERAEAEINAKQKLGILKRGDQGYWNFKENIEKEILNYIEIYGNVDGLAKKDGSLDNAIRFKYKKELYEILTDFGLDFKDYFNVMPESYINNPENIIKDIKGFIEKEGRFPTVNEMQRELKLTYQVVARYNGINELRKMVGYVGKDTIVDDNNYNNRSIFEYKVSQYLIHNGISAKRDAFIFDNTRHTCDFVVESIDGEIYYIECWGYNSKSTNSVAIQYQNVRKEKEALYKENNLNLISIEYDDVMKVNNERAQEYLIEKLHMLHNKELKVFKNVEFLDDTKLTNDEILEILMKYSDDDNCLPYLMDVEVDYGYRIRKIISDRFGSYVNFSKHYNKKMRPFKRKKVS